LKLRRKKKELNVGSQVKFQVNFTLHVYTNTQALLNENWKIGSMEI